MTALHTRPVVLIVDDVPVNVAALAGVLGSEYEVRFATSGPEALDVVLASPDLDLVLLDVVMPGMDGYEVCRRIKASESPGVPVIFLTAKDDPRDEQEGFAAGAVDYITKPFRAPIVRARVRTHVELKRKSDTLASLALLDGLTGIANRRCFDDTVCLEWRRMARAHASLGLILIDVDHFKGYNDTYGHLAGDDCLRAVAACLKGAMSRAGDLTARIGGEEFAVVLPHCDSASGGRAAGRLQQAIAALALPHEASPVAPWVTLSMGVAAIQPAYGSTKHHLIDEADRALYEAKERGRNRVVLAPG